MTLIPDAFVEELRRNIDIVELISEYVQLRKSGRSFVGLCPFHNEKTPSFSVSPDRQMYHCFGCGAGGTVIRFLMEMEGLSFVEAVTRLAGRANLPLPFIPDSETPIRSSDVRHQRMLDAHELAAKYYNYILMNTAAGVQALTYLESRGIQRQAMMDFRLGVAPDSEDRLVTFLGKRGYDRQLLLDAGLAVQLGSRVVDRFRNRVMIPICDSQGRVVSFGGRALHADAKPKYLNSPETQLFHKSSLLFNLHQARREIRRTQTAVLFEGYMDVIAAWQAGVRNGVASMGTSLTEDHLKVLRRYADRLTIAFDGDAAGVKATRRAIELAEGHRFQIRIAQLPDGKDPDDFIREFGPAAFQRLVTNRLTTVVDFLLTDLRRSMDTQSPAGRTDYIRQSLAILARRATPIEQDSELRKLSQEFHISYEALKEELSLVTKQHDRRRSRERRVAPSPQAQLARADVLAGNLLLQAALTDEGAFQGLLERGVDELPLPEQTALLALWYHFRSEHPDRSAVTFIDTLDDPRLTNLATSLLMEDLPEFTDDVIDDCLRTLQLSRLEEELQQTMRELVACQVEGRVEQVNDFRERAEALRQAIDALKSSRQKGQTPQG